MVASVDDAAAVGGAVVGVVPAAPAVVVAMVVDMAATDGADLVIPVATELFG